MLRIHSIVEKENNKPKRMFEREKKGWSKGMERKKEKAGTKRTTGACEAYEACGACEACGTCEA